MAYVSKRFRDSVEPVKQVREPSLSEFCSAKQPSTSLDSITCHSATWKRRSSWDKKQRRGYQRAISGLKRALFRGERVFFLTLTSSPKRGLQFIAKDWDLLVKRVRRELGFRFDFFKVITAEGFGVIHALIVCNKFDFGLGAGWCYEALHAYFSCLWAELHLAPVVWIREAYRVNGGYGKLAAYCINQYVVGQSFLHLGYSGGWCFRGFVKRFYELIREFGFSKGLRLFDYMVKFFVPCGRAKTLLM